MAFQDNELNNLVNGLRGTAQRLRDQTEAIAGAIQRIANVQRTIGTPVDHTGETFPHLSPEIRALRDRHASRPQHESSRIPDGPPNPHGRLPAGLSPIGPRNVSNNCHPESHSRHPSRAPFTSCESTLGEVQFRVDQSSTDATDDGRCRCTTYDGSTIADARFRIDSRSDSPSAPTGSTYPRTNPSSTGPSGSLPSFRDRSDFMRALFNWWSSFILQNLNSETEIIPGDSNFRSTLNEIVVRWEEMSQSENSGNWSSTYSQ